MEKEDSSTIFCPGDHVYLPCNAAGIPYEHHAIVLSVMPHLLLSATDDDDDEEKDDDCILCVADFTADGANASIASSGTLSMSSCCHHNNNNENDNASAAATETSCSSSSSRGLRILQVAAKDWYKIHYPESTSTSPVHIVRSRVQFLLEHPHHIPSYSLVESNCECVAVWCKTGRWTTLQAERVLKTTNHGAKVALAGFAAVAQWTPLVVPGVFVAASVVTEVVTGLLCSHANKQWEEQTRRLNQAFGGGEVEDCDKEKLLETGNKLSNLAAAPDRNVCDPFSDERSLRAMVTCTVADDISKAREL